MLLDNYLVDENECWIWQGSISSQGYPKQGTISVHVLHCAHKHGPLGEGYEPDHTCRVRACCNPDHLEPVTRKENLNRGAGTKVSEELADKIRAAVGSTRQLAKIFGISKSQIHLIKNGRRR